MKIFNYSNLYCDRELWHDIATCLRLGGKIRDAELYGKKELSVVIHKQKSKCEEDLFEYGCCTPPRVDIYPCGACTSGTIFHAFLGCLASMWIYQNYEDLYYSEWIDEFGDRFANSLFLAPGGRILKKKNCQKFKWTNKPVADDRLDKVHSILYRLDKTHKSKVRRFRFPR
jgi:hypothetical protein